MVLSKQEHYIGIDVGTGSARACIIDTTGEIKALAAKDIKLWQPVSGDAAHYVCCTVLLFHHPAYKVLTNTCSLGAIHH